MSLGIVEILSKHESRQALLCHPFFALVRDSAITRADAGTFLGQWWHPLHYFPVFLARTISVLPRQDTKTEISKILYQELGEGDPQRAHERVFVDTMLAAGFAEPALTAAPPFSETRKLIDGYASASQQPMEALGFLYGTEVADLTMVSGIGHAVRKTTGADALPWVDIHVHQEPEHVIRANAAVASPFAPEQLDEIIHNAERMWKLWVGFFDRLQSELSYLPAKQVSGLRASAI